jgi:prepilin-type N-terminal cleavage/methylation domain-containing protein
MMNRAKGFSLVEMVMVIVIIGALSIIAISKFNLNSFESAAYTTELAAAIRYAQEKSMSNSGAADYQIAINGTNYRVTQAGADIPHPVTGAGIYQPSWTNVALAPTGVISFDAYGTPTLSGGLSWSGNQEVIAVTVGSDTGNVVVEQVTGFAR